MISLIKQYDRKSREGKFFRKSSSFADSLQHLFSSHYEPIGFLLILVYFLNDGCLR